MRNWRRYSLKREGKNEAKEEGIGHCLHEVPSIQEIDFMIKVFVKKIVVKGRYGENIEYLAREYDDGNSPDVENSELEYGRFDTLEDAIESVAETFNSEEFVLRLDI